MACRSRGLRDLRRTPHELVTGRQMPTPVLRTSGKGPSLSLLEDEMKAYVKYIVTLHKNISTYVLDRQKQDEAQEWLAEQKRDALQPGDKVFMKVFRRKWFNERREGTFAVVRSTRTAVQVKGSPTWYHVSHCVKAPSEEEIQTQGQKDEDSGGSRERPDRLQTRKQDLEIFNLKILKKKLTMPPTLTVLVYLSLMMPVRTGQSMNREEG